MDASSTSIPLPLFPGMLFMDRYYIVEEVGAGGFGSVYKAQDTQNEKRLVAIKEVSLEDLPARTRMEATCAFEREASLLSQLNHASLPRLYDYFQRPERWYLVMDFIVGETLDVYQSKAPRQRPLLSDTLDIGIQLCTVLHYLHSQQPPIIFRDLKPTNIIRGPTGKIYLIDFGIARYFKFGQPKDTMALGSPGYAAPEQYGKAQTTPRDDIYSLGAVLHQLLTTRDPSEAPFRFTPLRPKNSSDPGSLTTSMVEILVNKLERLIASMLCMDANQRPADALSVKEELQIISTLWSEIHRSYWRPKLGYTSRSGG